MNKKLFVTVAVGTIACALVGAGAGTAIGSSPTFSTPKGITVASGLTSTPAPSPSYKKNAHGKSFGSALAATSPTDMPDLVLVTATNGTQGYVTSSDLAQAEGPTTFSSPADALKWQDSVAGTTSTLSVFAQDGTTVIGQFVIAHSSPAAVERAQPASK